jgi:hypothetical protein
MPRKRRNDDRREPFDIQFCSVTEGSCFKREELLDKRKENRNVDGTDYLEGIRRTSSYHPEISGALAGRPADLETA